MCGLAGFTTFRAASRRKQDIISAMTACLARRGPDDAGLYSDAAATLGHRRLSIIDKEGGHQPMSFGDGRYLIVCNGEFYNYLELRAELAAKGACFATQSDTEVLLQLYAQQGPEALTRVNGMFALAIWDRLEQTLFLARDRIGKKPLFYSIQGGDIVFASELAALLKHPSVEKNICPSAVNKFLTFGYIPAPHTVFKNIFKLDPGTWLLFSASGMKKNRYWDLPLADAPLSYLNRELCAERLLALLRDSVRLRLRSDVPVGLFLSGGIDSSAIAALAARESGNRLPSFSIGFEEASYDESRYARRVARLCNTDHHHEVLSGRQAAELIPEVLALPGEPFADASLLPTFMLARLARTQVKVALSGDGSDELFAGYPAFQAHRIVEQLSVLPAGWRSALLRLVDTVPLSHAYTSIDFRLREFLKGAGISPEIRFMLWMGFCGTRERTALLTDELRRDTLRDNPFDDVEAHVRQSRLISDFQRISYLCTKMYLQDGVLVKVDRASMANSLEVRSPFLDCQVVEFAAGISPRDKLRGLTTKYILKKALRQLLPRDIINRRKAGFMMPVASWLATDLRPLLEDFCSEDALRRDGLFRPEMVRRLIEEHVGKKRDHRKTLWLLLCFQVWKHTFLR